MRVNCDQTVSPMSNALGLLCLAVFGVGAFDIAGLSTPGSGTLGTTARAPGSGEGV